MLDLLSATEWEDVSEPHEGFAKALIPLSCGMDGLSCCVSSDADKMSLILILYFNAKVAKGQGKHAANKMQEWEAVKLKGNAETRRLTLLSATEGEDVSESDEGLARALIPLSCGMDGQSCFVSLDAERISLILILHFNAKVAKGQRKHAANKMQEWEAVKLKGNAETRRLTLLSATEWQDV